ncbi:MAG: hypothetical protein HQM10_14395 [Candidatus Riflebacteria bacterium]|nr:hypothetical protein [Candidatus Riflebacteria bacterium]
MNSRKTEKMRMTNSFRGMTLIEVILALLIMLLMVGTFLRVVMNLAQVGEDNEKMQMANKILQSIKEEICSVRFEDFHTFTSRNQAGQNGDYLLDDIFWPHSREEVMNYQRRYRDFEASGTFKYVQRSGRDPMDHSVIYFKVFVTWFQPNAGKPVKSLSMIIVEPKT